MNTQFKRKNSKRSKPWFSSIWPICRILSDAATEGQNGPEIDGNEGLFHITESSYFTGTLSLHYIVSYPRHLLGESYSSSEKQSVYSTAPADRSRDQFYNKPGVHEFQLSFSRVNKTITFENY